MAPKEFPEDPPTDNSGVTMKDAGRAQRKRFRRHAVEWARALLADHLGWSWKMKLAWKRRVAAGASLL